jgi:hypothetical protein
VECDEQGESAVKVSRKAGTAYVILGMIQKLYLIEREAKDFTPEERKELMLPHYIDRSRVAPYRLPAKWV